MSPRYLSSVCAGLALACVPTILHSYIGMTVEDKRSVSRIPNQLIGLEGTASGRSAAWVLDLYGTSDFIERHYGPSLTLFVARSFDAKRLYHHPELGIAHGDGYERAVVVRPPQRPELPVFVLNSRHDRLSAYALLYGNELIDRPMRFQLKNALALLVRPRELMTLFFVRGKIDTPSQTATTSVESLLVAAIDSFVEQRGNPTP